MWTTTAKKKNIVKIIYTSFNGGSSTSSYSTKNRAINHIKHYKLQPSNGATPNNGPTPSTSLPATGKCPCGIDHSCYYNTCY